MEKTKDLVKIIQMIVDQLGILCTFLGWQRMIFFYLRQVAQKTFGHRSAELKSALTSVTTLYEYQHKINIFKMESVTFMKFL